MKITFTEKTVNLPGKLYTVIIPEGTEGFINDGYIFDADRKGLETIFAAAYLLYRNKNLIVYFPLWKNPLPESYRLVYPEDKRRMIRDVVLTRHSVQLPVSDWKEIRSRLKKTHGEKHTSTVNFEREFPVLKDKHDKLLHNGAFKFRRRENVFKFTVQFDTCFFVGRKPGIIDFLYSIGDLLTKDLEEYLVTTGGSYWTELTCDSPKPNDCHPELGFYDDVLYEKYRQNSVSSH